MKKKSIKFIIYFIIMVVLDQVTKYLIIDKNIPLISNLVDFKYIQNYGGAFGVGNINLVTIFSILLILGIIVYVIVKRKDITNFYPFILILSGSIGNLIDRLFRGYVIDFIKIHIFDFPCFNIADICVTFGIIWLILWCIFKLIKKDKINMKNSDK